MRAAFLWMPRFYRNLRKVLRTTQNGLDLPAARNQDQAGPQAHKSNAKRDLLRWLGIACTEAERSRETAGRML